MNFIRQTTELQREEYDGLGPGHYSLNPLPSVGRPSLDSKGCNFATFGVSPESPRLDDNKWHTKEELERAQLPFRFDADLDHQVGWSQGAMIVPLPPHERLPGDPPGVNTRAQTARVITARGPATARRGSTARGASTARGLVRTTSIDLRVASRQVEQIQPPVAPRTPTTPSADPAVPYTTAASPGVTSLDTSRSPPGSPLPARSGTAQTQALEPSSPRQSPVQATGSPTRNQSQATIASTPHPYQVPSESPWATSPAELFPTPPVTQRGAQDSSPHNSEQDRAEALARLQEEKEEKEKALVRVEARGVFDTSIENTLKLSGNRYQSCFEGSSRGDDFFTRHLSQTAAPPKIGPGAYDIAGMADRLDSRARMQSIGIDGLGSGPPKPSFFMTAEKERFSVQYTICEPKRKVTTDPKKWAADWTKGPRYNERRQY